MGIVTPYVKRRNATCYQRKQVRKVPRRTPLMRKRNVLPCKCCHIPRIPKRMTQFTQTTPEGTTVNSLRKRLFSASVAGYCVMISLRALWKLS